MVSPVLLCSACYIVTSMLHGSSQQAKMERGGSLTSTYAPELAAKRYASVYFCAAPLEIRI